MTPPISTGRERRVATLPHRLSDDDRRSGTDRRVASYRKVVDWIIDLVDGFEETFDLILALRRPRGVVVAEGPMTLTDDRDDCYFGHSGGTRLYADTVGKRVAVALMDAAYVGHRVRVVVEKCDE